MKTKQLFHMEQKLVILCAASAILAGGAEPLYGQNNNDVPCPALHPDEERAVEEIVLATENRETSRIINLALQDTLLGYDSRARAYYIRALNLEPQSAIALCGLMLLEQSDRSQYTQQLQQLTAIINSPDFLATPEELFYIETFLKIISGDVSGAADDFAKRSERYRADILTACWAVSLYHSLGDEEKSRSLSQRLFEKHSENVLCLYLHCLVYENEKKIPCEIIKLSRELSASWHHPMVLHLSGHLMNRNGMFAEARDCFCRERNIIRGDILAFRIDKRDSFELHRAGLYECASALKSSGPEFHMELLNEAKLEKEVLHRGDVLYRWEVMTQPLRELVMRPTPPSAKEVRRAVQSSVPHETIVDDDLCHQFSECLKSVLQVRVLVNSKRMNKANEVLEKAEQAYIRLRDSRDSLSMKSMTYTICYMRALDCAETSLNIARSLVFSDSASMWNNKVQDSLHQQKQFRMLPPMLVPVSFTK